VTDQGRHFINDVLKELLQRMLVKHRKANSYYPQANSLVEKTNGTLVGIIAKIVVGQKRSGTSK
jgi:hypothetical protein